MKKKVITRAIKDRYNPWSKLPTNIIKHSGLSINEKYILYLLYTNKSNFKETQASLIRRCEGQISESTVKRCVKSLKAKKLLGSMNKTLFPSQKPHYLAGYTKVSNSVLRSTELNPNQIHILVTALTNNDYFQLKVEHLLEQSGIGRNKFYQNYTPMKELGYFKVTRFKVGNNWHSNVSVYETVLVSKQVHGNSKKGVKTGMRKVS